MQPSEAPWPSPARAWYVTTLLCGGYFLSYVDRTIIALLIEPIKRDLGFSDTAVSLLVGTAFALFFAVFGLVFGRLADLYSRRLIVAGGVALWSVATLGCGMVSGFWSLFAMRATVGIGEASLHPSAVSMLADLFPRERRARAVGVYIASGVLGGGGAYFVGGAVLSALASLPQIVSTPMGTFYSWQLAFMIVGVPGFLISALFLLTTREPERRELVAEEKPAALIAFMRGRRGDLLALFIGVGIALIPVTGAIAWLPAMFQRSFGWSGMQAGVAIGIVVMLTGPAGSVFSTWLADRFRRRGDAASATLASICIAGGGLPLLAASMLAPTPAIMLALFGPAIFLISGLNALPPLAIQDLAPNRLRAQTVSVYFLLVNVIGFAFGPTMIALTTDYVFADEKRVAWSIALTCVWALPIALFVLARALPRFRQAAAEIA